MRARTAARWIRFRWYTFRRRIGDLPAPEHWRARWWRGEIRRILFELVLLGRSEVRGSIEGAAEAFRLVGVAAAGASAAAEDFVAAYNRCALPKVYRAETFVRIEPVR